jgi:hypothetical protein
MAEVERSHLIVSRPWLGVVKLAAAAGIAYFLSWILRVEPGIAVF